MVDLVEICNVCARKAIIEAAKRIINSDKVCHSYSDLNFGVTFLEHSVCIDLTLQRDGAKFSNCRPLAEQFGRMFSSATCDYSAEKKFGIICGFAFAMFCARC